MMLRYRNEIIVAVALLFALGALAYKYTHRTSVEKENRILHKEIVQLNEAVSLKKRWADKQTEKKLEELRKYFPHVQTTWKKSGKKLVAVFTALKPEEANRLVTKLLNIAVQIEHLKIEKQDKTYRVEMTCKW